MSQTEIWLSISVPIAVVSLLLSYILLVKYKPMPKRKLIVGILIGLLALGIIIGSSFINEYVLAAVVGLILPPIALWSWFMMQPSIRAWDKRRESNLEKHRKKHGR